MASKSKSRRRVFRASCILAALIVAGSSFAWFTSKDEVTNRLSASGDYDVTIAEDFTPPAQWLPGQKVDKNVGAVNTGTIDAFVRMWLEGEMNVLNEKRDTQKWNDTAKQFTDKAGTPKVTLALGDTYFDSGSNEGKIGDGTKIMPETDQDLIDKNLTYYYMDDDTKKDSKISLKELDKTNLYNNPNSPITEVSSPDGYTEVMALQAGGELVYVKTTNGIFEFTFEPNQTQNIVSAGYTDNSTNPATTVGGTRYDILGGNGYTVKVGEALASTDDIEVNGTTINVKDLATFYKYIGDNIDTNTFEPKTTGLYIFKRNTKLDDNKYEDSEYTGYYYVAKDGTDAGAEGKFFALQYENDGSTRSSYVLDKDTYTITRDETGKETFVPSNSTADYNSKTYYKVGTDYYDEDGFKVTDASIKSALDNKTFTDENSVTLYTAKKDVIKNSELTWKYAEQPGAKPANGTVATVGTTNYTYDASAEQWKDGNGVVATGSDLTTLQAVGPKMGLEIEDNGVVYTYKNGNDGPGWYKAGATNKETGDSADRLDAAINKHATLTATYYGAENADVLAGTKNPAITTTTDAKYQDPSDDISVIVNLNNVNKDVAEAWTAILNSQSREATAAGSDPTTDPAVSDAWGAKNSDQVTFYYNNDVEEGATTRKLVDSVELSSATQKNAYLGFDFDLNVNMESKQITINDNGKEGFETVNNSSWGNTKPMGDAKGSHNGDQSGTEIEKIAWTEVASANNP